MEATFVILFSIASFVAIVARLAHLPYTVALVAVGLAVGALNLVEAPHLTKELLFAVFLPGLVFEAAYNIHARELRSMWRTI
ncbi:MAG: cation:proton antiporter, partial [Gemmatimonadaceae bacterium]